LIVPPGTQELYAAAGVWKNFGANITAVALSVNTNSILFGKNKEMSAKINVTSNTSWTVSADVDWLSIGRINGSGNSFFAVTAYRNNTGTERTGVITVSNTFGNVTQSITVTQDAAN
jgi:poly(beta-D-mannuronate) lyase